MFNRMRMYQDSSVDIEDDSNEIVNITKKKSFLKSKFSFDSFKISRPTRKKIIPFKMSNSSVDSSFANDIMRDLKNVS